MRKRRLLSLATCFVLAAGFTLPEGDAAVAATKSQRCETYAHNAARSAPTRGGRFAARLSEPASAPSGPPRARARPSGPAWARRGASFRGAAPTTTTITDAWGADPAP